MKKIANALIVVGVGVVVFSILYSIQIKSFSEESSAVILFVSSLFIITGILVRAIVNKTKVPKEKFYSKVIFMSLYLISVTYFLVRSLL